MHPELETVAAEIRAVTEVIQRARQAIHQIVVGQEALVDRLLIALLVDGHLLLEGLPGLGKTLAASTLAKITRCEFKRIQFTPDLLPADLTGTAVYHPKEGTFSVKKGPLFTNIVLADEINRAPGKVHSALLEVMQERQITIGGETFKTGNPYLVIATQNPIEQEGTYPLPEAQTDRFLMKVKLSYPSLEEEKEIVMRYGHVGKQPEITPVLSIADILSARQTLNRIYVDPKLIDYILRIVFATRDPKKYHIEAQGLIEYGASPRASLALKLCGQAMALLLGRAYVTPQDIKLIAPDVLRHRVRLSFEGEAQELTSDALIERILKTLPVP